ncbi:YidH family protein [Nguyenibacter vanlangensis]|uniref:DUF202 domain-containing protein n=1 Tax=Nguyenibacter vanlangensis TaxID=1216886 RepID=A0A7Y7IVI9_9PROT|nr:DUF202 domain-containing protein [Nguyenibacter vanlangensis]NVN11072.1 DUF202 domain-containing protein [Nguyenibacter vanlangensis]
MISRYTGHAANERTFLAWMRTALAILAFGGVLTKFDLLPRLVAARQDAGAPRPHGYFLVISRRVYFQNSILNSSILFFEKYSRNSIAH